MGDVGSRLLASLKTCSFEKVNFLGIGLEFFCLNSTGLSGLDDEEEDSSLSESKDNLRGTIGARVVN